MMPGETARDSGLTAQQEIYAVMVEVVNRLKTEINEPQYSPERPHRLNFIYPEFNFN